MHVFIIYMVVMYVILMFILYECNESMALHYIIYCMYSKLD